MAINVHQETHIPTEEAVAIVIPLIQEWFDLGDRKNILENMSISRTMSGGAHVEITLGMVVDKTEMERLEEALADKGLVL